MRAGRVVAHASKAQPLADELVISIGPPCCGKSTWLAEAAKGEAGRADSAQGAPSGAPEEEGSRPEPRHVLDVAIDDTEYVYRRIGRRDAVAVALHRVQDVWHACVDMGGGAGKPQRSADRRFRELRRALLSLGDSPVSFHAPTTLGEKELRDLSVSFGGEASIILLRLSDLLDGEVAKALLRFEVLRSEKEAPGREDWQETEALASAAADGLDMAWQILQARKAQEGGAGGASDESAGARSRGLVSCETVAVFQPIEIDGAVEEAIDRLHKALSRHEGPVAWGNTNTRCRDFQAALSAAYDAKRPVRFAVWGRELPRVPLRVLCTRNVLRFAAVGRHVPTGTIARATKRVESMLRQAVQNGDAKDPLDVKLADEAGFTMDPASRRIQNKSPYKKRGQRRRRNQQRGP